MLFVHNKHIFFIKNLNFWRKKCYYYLNLKQQTMQSLQNIYNYNLCPVVNPKPLHGALYISFS